MATADPRPAGWQYRQDSCPEDDLAPTANQLAGLGWEVLAVLPGGGLPVGERACTVLSRRPARHFWADLVEVYSQHRDEEGRADVWTVADLVGEWPRATLVDLLLQGLEITAPPPPGSSS